MEDIIQRLRDELEPALRAAAQATRGELERTRAWLEERGLPKAARVAQREAYNVLRRYGAVRAQGERSRAELTVGRHERPPYVPRPLAPDEIHELAEICVAMLKSHGQAIEATLATVSSEAGGYLLPEDAPRVRDLARAMLAADGAGEGRPRPPSSS
ncbi:MAG TPA: hypothetical protein VNO70_27265 [Blastocatellia bacterium]|nr:hypothetical protein [Blastocatellia bacterium]